MRGVRRGVGRTVVRRQVLVELARDLGAAPAFREAHDPEHPHAPIKRDRQDIAGLHGPARGVDPHPVAPDVPRHCKRDRGGARSHDPGVP